MATIRLRIQSKLLLAFIAVGLLSILVGVFVPLRIISWLSPRESRERLLLTQRNIMVFYDELVREPQAIGEKLNQFPDFVRAFQERDRVAILTLLMRYEQQLGYKFGTDGSPRVPTPWDMADYRFAQVLLTPEDYEIWASRLPVPGESGSSLIRLLPWPSREQTFYLAGSATPIRNSSGEILGGLLIGRPLIVKNPKQMQEPDYFLDRDFFSDVFEQYYNVSIESVGAESPRLLESLERFPEIRSRLMDRRQTGYLEDARFGNVDSQILLMPVEDTDSNLINILFLHIPLPPETLAWRGLTSTFYYGVVFAFILAFIMAYYVSRTISRPIKQLSEGALALSKGDMDYRVSVNTQDEVGELARIFVEMRRRLGQTLDELQQRARTIEEKNIALDQSLAEILRMRDFTEDILRSIDGGVLTFDLHCRVTKINQAARRILRVPDDTTEAECLPLIPVEILEMVRKVLRSGQPVEYSEIQVRQAEGHEVPINLSVSLLRSEGGIIGAVATFYDLTQIRALKEQIRRQEHLAALGTLSAGIAHEVRNPLGIIRGAAEILQKRFGHLKEEEGLSEFIIEEVKRLSLVVTDFLDFARPRSPNFHPADLSQILRRSLQLANLPGDYALVKPELDLEDSLPLLELDTEQCQQAFLNLILNAAQAMPDGGTLWLRARHDLPSHEVIVEVADSGPGMDAETQALIFNPFFTTKDEGTGLGLSIVHRIVENHHARISVESSPGQGCTFRIRFAVSTASDATSAEDPVKVERNQPGSFT